MSHHPRVRAVAATGLADHIETLGGRPARIIEGAGLDPAILERPLEPIALASYCALFEHAAASIGAPHFGLRYGVAHAVAIWGDLGELSLAAPTLLAGLASLTRYMPALQEQSSLSLAREGSRVVLSYAIRDGRITERRQDAELSIAALAGFLRHVAGPGFAPDEVRFEHKSAGQDRDATAALRTRVRFGEAANAVVFPASLLELRMPDANPAAFAELAPIIAARARGAAPDDLIGLVREEIRRGLPSGAVTLPCVAERLGVAPATLYRRLRAGGVEFGEVLRAMRQELALSLLAEPDMALSEIAGRLGYSELSAFSRAFRAWTGMGAAAYRRGVAARCR